MREKRSGLLKHQLGRWQENYLKKKKQSASWQRKKHSGLGRVKALVCECLHIKQLRNRCQLNAVGCQ